MRNQATAFPVGLYGMLLFALTWLTLPRVFAPMERFLVGCACAVPRVCSSWFGEPVAAADADALGRVQRIGRQLLQVVLADDTRCPVVDRGVVGAPVACAVHAVIRRGGGGEFSELRLDHSYRELAGCRPWVTKGEVLVGTLAQPGVGVAENDQPDDPARVLLLSHREAKHLYAGAESPDGGRLRFVLRAASTVDPAPLRVDLWDDPYRAARLEGAGHVVRTLQLDERPDRPPAGLLVGHTRIWGYERREQGDVLTIGVFVVPAIPPRALSSVVLWRAADPLAAPARAESPSARSLRDLDATVYDLPGAVHGRHLLVASGAVPDGAAVVQDGLFLGTARGLAFGAGLVTSFPASRQPWTLWVLPDDPALSPRCLHAEVVRSEGNVAWLRYERTAFADDAVPAGSLFTGNNGPHCPSGLWIGRVLPMPDAMDLLQVQTPAQPGPRKARVFVAEGGP